MTTTQSRQVTAEMVEIARHGGFVLYERPNKANGAWRSFKLINPDIPGNYWRKRNWWFGCNGERVSLNRDVKLLQEHNPDAYRWIMETLVGL
jgi:hypothetical protein